jgi:3-oxoacyl-[acyl-carrier protein] reductase
LREDNDANPAKINDRFGLPEEVAAMAPHLVGPRARYITGQTIHVNGGVYPP